MHAVTTDTAASQAPPFPQVISSLLEGAVATFDSDRSSARGYLVKALALLRVRHAISRAHGETRNTRPQRALAVWQMNRVVDYIESNLTEKINGADLAAHIDVSLGQLFRGFKASLGVTPFTYITRRRVDLACHMMKTTQEPLAQIALACGLCDQSQFCRIFRRATGMSPAKWRRENSVGPAPANTIVVSRVALTAQRLEKA